MDTSKDVRGYCAAHKQDEWHVPTRARSLDASGRQTMDISTAAVVSVPVMPGGEPRASDDLGRQMAGVLSQSPEVSAAEEHVERYRKAWAGLAAVPQQQRDAARCTLLASLHRHMLAPSEGGAGRDRA